MKKTESNYTDKQKNTAINGFCRWLTISVTSLAYSLMYDDKIALLFFCAVISITFHYLSDVLKLALNIEGSPTNAIEDGKADEKS